MNYNKIMLNESNAMMDGQDAQKLNLVFSGGGARGVAYVGAYAALQDAQVMDQVQKVSGISAGSIMATMVALGVKPELVREKLFQQDFPSLLGERTRRRQPFSVRFIS